MRKALFVGVLVLLVLIVGYTAWQGVAAPTDAKLPATITVILDDEDLAKLKALKPKLFLRDEQGETLAVQAWSATGGQVLLEQVDGLQRRRYTLLVAEYAGIGKEELLVSIDLTGGRD